MNEIENHPDNTTREADDQRPEGALDFQIDAFIKLEYFLSNCKETLQAQANERKLEQYCL